MDHALFPADAARPIDPGRRFAETRSIGQASRTLKHRHFRGRIWSALLGVALVFTGAMTLGQLLGGIGFAGLFLTALSALLAAALLLNYPRLAVPRRIDLARGPLPDVVGQTELWLESRAAALPPAAGRLVDHLGMQLDALGLELARIDGTPPAAAEIRHLIGRRLPAAIAANGSGPDGETRLVYELERIGADLAFITRHLAGGTLDARTLRARGLEVRF